MFSRWMEGEKDYPRAKGGGRERAATLIVNEPESEGTQEKAKSILQEQGFLPRGPLDYRSGSFTAKNVKNNIAVISQSVGWTY